MASNTAGNTSGEPERKLSDEQLAEIASRRDIARFMRETNGHAYSMYQDEYIRDVTALLAEVERLRARGDDLLSLSVAALDNSRRQEAEMHTALTRILDDAALFGWESNAVQAARRVARKHKPTQQVSGEGEKD